jgi:hypothetical protein
VNALLIAALAYAARGWAVLPLAPQSKRPASGLAPHGVKDATTDGDIIRGWWANARRANIGLATGLCFDVLDIDGSEGWRSVAHAVQANSCLASVPCSMTPGDGAHYLFEPTGHGNRTAFLPGLDWKGPGGYIVAPPSEHPSGGIYEWAVGPADAPVQPAPTWLVADVARASVETPVPRGSSRRRAYAWAALERECGRVAHAQPGTRNDALNRAAYSLSRFVAVRDLDIDEVIDGLLRAASAGGLETFESRRTIASGLRAGLGPPRELAR